MQILRSKRIKQLAINNERKILRLLGLDCDLDGFQGSCPIHEGDNPSAFSFNTEKHCWSCFTHKCEKKHGNDIIGFIMSKTGKNFSDTIDWLESILLEDDDGKIDWTTIDTQLAEKEQYKSGPIRVLDERLLLRLKADYSCLSDRLFKKETIDFFEGGIPIKPKGDCNYRFMIPIREHTRGLLVGLTGRTLYPFCEKTGFYHPCNAIPSDKYKRFYSKWRNYPRGFRKEMILYNLHNAKSYISKTNTVIITEGPFDVWRMWENGVKNVVSPLGSTMSQHQIALLDKYDCINVICLLDPDNAGKQATIKIKQQMGDKFKFYAPNISCDPAELKEDEYNSYLKPILQKISVYA